MVGGTRRKPDPTPEQIAQRILDIQSQWTDLVEKARRAVPHTKRWEIPRVPWPYLDRDMDDYRRDDLK